MKNLRSSVSHVLFLAVILVTTRGAVTFAQGLRPPVLGTISGRVTLDNGQPAVGYSVTAYRASNPFFRYDQDNPNTTITNKQGRYTIMLRSMHTAIMNVPYSSHAEGYGVFIGKPGQSYSSLPASPYIQPPTQDVDPIAIPNHAATGINFVLRLGPEVTIHAQDALTGAPDDRLKVEVLAFASVLISHHVTRANGSTRFRVPLTQFGLRVTLPSGLEAASGYGIGSQLEKQITAKPGQQVVWIIKTYSNAERDNAWHGTVLEPNGKPAVGVTVNIQRSVYGGSKMATTNAQGHFSVTLPLFAQEEEVSFSIPIIYVRQGTLVAAQAVTPDESWNGMTLHLTRGASLSGTLTDPHGHPAAYVAVSLSGQVLGVQPLQYGQPQAVTDTSGHFLLTGLPAGTYQLTARGGGYGVLQVPPIISGLSSNAQTPLQLAPGQQRDLGLIADPHANRVLTGQVTDQQGHPVSHLWLRLTGTYTNQNGMTQQDGTFRFYDVVNEPLTLTAGLSNQVTTLVLKAGQTDVHLTVPPDVVTGATSPVPPPARPAGNPGPLRVTPYDGGTGLSSWRFPLNGLVLSFQSDDAGAVTAMIVRTNDLARSFYVPPLSGPFSSYPPGSIQTLWQGPLSQLEGMHLAVRNDHGTLTDSTGHVLWSGVVVDPPDYRVISKQHDHDATMTVQNRRGQTLWSGAVAPRTFPVVDGEIRAVTPQHTVAWERAVGNARVAETLSWPDLNPGYDWKPVDADVTFHSSVLTGTLRSAQGQVLWSGSVPMLMTQATGFPPQPHPKVLSDNRPTPAYTAWIMHRMALLPPPELPFIIIQGMSHGATLTYTTMQGGAVPSATEQFP